MWWLARTFEAQLVDFLEWLQRYQWWAVGISIALVARGQRPQPPR